MPLSVDEKLRELESDPNWRTVRLPVDGRQDRREQVLVERVIGGRLRIAASPGMVLGLAADDIIVLDHSRPEGYRLLERGGNLCAHHFCQRGDLRPLRGDVTAALARLGGWLDGTMKDRGMCFTVPVSAGFAAVERVLDSAVESHPGAAWFYSNVYELADGVTPLRWWEDKSG